LRGIHRRQDRASRGSKHAIVNWLTQNKKFIPDRQKEIGIIDDYR
jgi:hypothetical protein